MSTTEVLEFCARCGATIYPEHIQSRKAERIAGKLFCIHCTRESAGGHAPPLHAGAETPHENGAAAEEVTVNAPESDAAPPAAPRKTAIAFDRPTAARLTNLQRPLDPASPLATRCRVFHCRLSDASVRNMEEQINEWVDSQDDIRIKFSTSSVGSVDGKSNDPHLFVTLFY